MGTFSLAADGVKERIGQLRRLSLSDQVRLADLIVYYLHGGQGYQSGGAAAAALLLVTLTVGGSSCAAGVLPTYRVAVVPGNARTRDRTRPGRQPGRRGSIHVPPASGHLAGGELGGRGNGPALAASRVGRGCRRRNSELSVATRNQLAMWTDS